jgi:hypothetical protein
LGYGTIEFRPNSLAPLAVPSLTSSDPQFSVSFSRTCYFDSQGCSIDLTFAPTAAGLQRATLTINSNAANGPLTLTLTGTGD